MKLTDMHAWVVDQGISEHVYVGRVSAKYDKSIGIYHSKHQQAYRKALGGHENESYGVLYVTFLIHWNDRIIESDEAAQRLFELLDAVRNVRVNDQMMKWVQLLYEVQDVGTDANGVFERVIEAAVYYDRKENE